MYQLSVCADTVFLELPFEERVVKIADADFCVEFAGWKGRDMDAIRRNAKVRMGSIVATGAGSMLHPEDADAFVESVSESITVAKSIGSRELVLLAGVLGAKGEVIHRTHPHPITRWITAYKTLARLAEIAQANDVVLNLEHLNTKVDHVGYGVGKVEEAARLVSEVGSPHLRILLDIYHAQVEEGDVISLIRRFGHLIGYVHVADVPGRHEPGTGELYYPRIGKALLEVGYHGKVGLEAFPLGDPYVAMERFRAQLTVTE